MRESHNQNLYVMLVDHMLQLNKDAYERRNGACIRRKDLPPISVGCNALMNNSVADTASYLNAKEFMPQLKFSLESLGTIGCKGGAANFRLGACAEQQAANNLLYSIGPIPSLNQIEFTQAFRPRTFISQRWCDTCHQIFD